MNTKLLLDLFHIPSQSGSENNVQNFILDFLAKNQIECEIDEIGNIYNISQTGRPLLSAHMDTVQDNFDVLMSKFIEIKGGVVKGYGVIGGDDKCGIYTILDLLENGHRDFNFVFSVQEEVGGIGIEQFIREQNLSHIIWGIVLDRRGSSDILCNKGHEYGVEDFERALLSVGKNFGFSQGEGTFSDADYISEQISCANISVGYYNAHQKNEYVVISELQNTINFVHYLVMHLDVYYEAPEKIFSYSSWSRHQPFIGYGYEEIDDYIDGYCREVTIDVCDICGTTSDDVKTVKTLGFKLCGGCKNDLLHELESEIIYDSYYEAEVL